MGARRINVAGACVLVGVAVVSSWYWADLRRGDRFVVAWLAIPPAVGGLLLLLTPAPARLQSLGGWLFGIGMAVAAAALLSTAYWWFLPYTGGISVWCAPPGLILAGLAVGVLRRAARQDTNP